VREAMLRLRLTFADEVGQDLWPVLARVRDAGRGPTSVDPLAECEAYLDEAVMHWEAETRARLNASELALGQSYRKAAGRA
jgi:hypothetical protein